MEKLILPSIKANLYIPETITASQTIKLHHDVSRLILSFSDKHNASFSPNSCSSIVDKNLKSVRKTFFEKYSLFSMFFGEH